MKPYGTEREPERVFDVALVCIPIIPAMMFNWPLVSSLNVARKCLQLSPTKASSRGFSLQQSYPYLYMYMWYPYLARSAVSAENFTLCFCLQSVWGKQREVRFDPDYCLKLQLLTTRSPPKFS